MNTNALAALALVSLIGLSFCQRSNAQSAPPTVSMATSGIDVVVPSPLAQSKYYLTDINNLATSGTIVANSALSASPYTKAQETAALATPPKLRAFVWTPAGTPPAGGWPAVVMMGGHAGIYSAGVAATDIGVYAKLSNRSKLWGEYWQSQGFVAVLVDDFGAYGVHGGFSVTADKRPGWASAANARPYFAYSALALLKAHFGNVNGNQVVLMGWSNGATTTLSAVAASGAPLPAGQAATTAAGFKAALTLYPACGIENRYAIPNNGVGGYNTYAPLHVINAGNDTEVDASKCDPKLLDVVTAKSGPMTSETMAGASHNFDANNAAANGVAANVTARDHALSYALSYFKTKLGIQ